MACGEEKATGCPERRGRGGHWPVMRKAPFISGEENEKERSRQITVGGEDSPMSHTAGDLTWANNGEEFIMFFNIDEQSQLTTNKTGRCQRRESETVTIGEVV